MMLEFSQYLENYLWPNFKHTESTHAHMMSIVVMLNEKFRERVDAWAVFNANPTEFPNFFQKVLEACLWKKPLTSVGYLREQTALLLFLNHCFNSLEVPLCRDQAKRLVSLSMWACLQPSKYLLVHSIQHPVLLPNNFLSTRTSRTGTEGVPGMAQIVEKITEARQARVERETGMGTTFFAGENSE